MKITRTSAIRLEEECGCSNFNPIDNQIVAKL